MMQIMDRHRGLEPRTNNPVIMSFALPDELMAVRWWPLLDLNQRPGDYESLALTTELKGRAENNNQMKSKIKPLHRYISVWREAIIAVKYRDKIGPT